MLKKIVLSVLLISLPVCAAQQSQSIAAAATKESVNFSAAAAQRIQKALLANDWAKKRDDKLAQLKMEAAQEQEMSNQLSKLKSGADVSAEKFHKHLNGVIQGANSTQLIQLLDDVSSVDAGNAN
jgi:hypothetical protein